MNVFNVFIKVFNVFIKVFKCLKIAFRIISRAKKSDAALFFDSVKSDAALFFNKQRLLGGGVSRGGVSRGGGERFSIFCLASSGSKLCM